MNNKITEDGEEEPPDVLTSGSSCCPYTQQRGDRGEGTVQHRDGSLIHAVEECIQRFGPRIAVLENVWGWALRESKSTEMSPLKSMLQRMATTCPDYVPKTFLLDSANWLVLRRKRLYVVFVREEFGGAAALARMSTLILDPSLLVLSVMQRANDTANVLIITAVSTRGCNNKLSHTLAY